MRHLDLFSGIGGFALAASWTWPNHEIAAFCDIDPFAHKVLNKHWPNVPIINDVRKINRETVHGTIDLVTGGFPCQPFSQAGKRKGRDDDRYLWPEMHRIITEFKPRWVLGENVSGLFTIENGLAFERVCFDLEASGYEVWPIRIPACATGAPHRRDRWWFVANSTSQRNRGIRDKGQTQGSRLGFELFRNGNRLPQPSSDPNPARSQGRTDSGGDGQDGTQPHDERLRIGPNWDQPWLEVASEFCRVDDGIPGRVDGDRKPRLKALGNAIVPQVAYQIMQAMKHADET